MSKMSGNNLELVEMEFTIFTEYCGNVLSYKTAYFELQLFGLKSVVNIVLTLRVLLLNANWER